MNYDLVVTGAFDQYAVGDRISDPSQIVAVLSSRSTAYFVRIYHSTAAAVVPPSVYTLADGDVVPVQIGGVIYQFTVAQLRAYLGVATPPVDPVIDTTAPIITASASQTVPENINFNLALTANEAVTWSKTGGADAALFTLFGATLGMEAKSFGAPADANGDNAYVVEVTATDAAGNASAPLTITVTVTEVAEGGGTSPPANDNVLSLTLDLGSSLAAF